MVSTLEVESSVFVVTITNPILTKKQSKLVNIGPKMSQNNDLFDKIFLALVYSHISPPKITANGVFAYRPMGF